MTVLELIAILKTMPQYAEVSVNDEHGTDVKIESVPGNHHERGYVIISAK